MKNVNTKKRAIWSSVLALFLCFAMLIGTTFAWFTDSVTSSNNIIQSGNLDVEFEYWNGTEWTNVEGASDILTNKLWEPGATEVAYFRIANAGSLALKYQLGVNIVTETEGVNVAGESFKLSDYIYFDVVDGQMPVFANRDAAMAYATETTLISAGYAQANVLASDEESFFAMVVYMPTTVGNVANHNGTDVPTIELGISIFATQVASEEDSFGPDYDAAAPIVTAPVARPDTAVILKGAEDVTIKLSEELINALPTEVTEIGMSVSKPTVEGNTVVFDSIELVDQNGNVIDLDALDQTITVTLPLPTTAPFADGETVIVYHDGVAVATATVVNGVISYDVEHLCEVTVGALEAPVVNGDTVTINNVSQFFAFAESVNTGTSYEGKTVVLGANIDLNNTKWTPIGDPNADVFVGFNGTFDGNGKTISNLYVEADTWGLGLFGYMTANATVKNFTVNNAYVKGTDCNGVIVGYATKGTFSGIAITGDVTVIGTAADGHVGGIAGCGYFASFDGCSVVANDGSLITSNGPFNGGIVGFQCTTNTITNCQVKNVTITGFNAIGSIAGIISSTGAITGCSVDNVVLNKTCVDSRPSIGLLTGCYDGKNTVNLTNNTVNNVTVNGSSVAYADYNIYSGCEYSDKAVAEFDLTGTVANGITDNQVTYTFVAYDDNKTVAENATALQNALNAATDGDIVCVGAGNWFATKYKPFTIKNDGVNFIGKDGAVLGFAETNTNSILDVYGDNVTVRNITFNVNKNEYNQCLLAIGADNLTVEGCTFYGENKDGGNTPTMGIYVYETLDNADDEKNDAITKYTIINNKFLGAAVGFYKGGAVKVPNDPGAKAAQVSEDMVIANNTFVGANILIENWRSWSLEANRDHEFVPTIANNTFESPNLCFANTPHSIYLRCYRQGNPDMILPEGYIDAFVANNTIATPTNDTVVTYNGVKYVLTNDYGTFYRDNATYGIIAYCYGQSYATLVETVDELNSALTNGGIYALGANMNVTEGFTVPAGVTVVLDLNGKTITGTDTATGSFGLITNRGDLTINGDGKITLVATNNRAWNAYSSVISNQPGGKLTVNGGNIQHFGGTDMAYGIDNLTNGKGTYAETVVNGGTIKSTYRAIRQFLNGVEAQNILTINGGAIEGANKSVWMQDPSKNSNTGTLTIGANAVLNGDVYLFVTAGSTEWPVEVSIAASAVNGEVITGNVPEGYTVEIVDGVWTVTK